MYVGKWVPYLPYCNTDSTTALGQGRAGPNRWGGDDITLERGQGWEKTPKKAVTLAVRCSGTAEVGMSYVRLAAWRGMGMGLGLGWGPFEWGRREGKRCERVRAGRDYLPGRVTNVSWVIKTESRKSGYLGRDVTLYAVCYRVYIGLGDVSDEGCGNVYPSARQKYRLGLGACSARYSTWAVYLVS